MFSFSCKNALFKMFKTWIFHKTPSGIIVKSVTSKQNRNLSRCYYQSMILKYFRIRSEEYQIIMSIMLT